MKHIASSGELPKILLFHGLRMYPVDSQHEFRPHDVMRWLSPVAKGHGFALHDIQAHHETDAQNLLLKADERFRGALINMGEFAGNSPILADIQRFQMRGMKIAFVEIQAHVDPEDRYASSLLQLMSTIRSNTPFQPHETVAIAPQVARA
jgi:hypothetical protein